MVSHLIAKITSIDSPHRLKVSHLNWRGLFIAKPNKIFFLFYLFSLVHRSVDWVRDDLFINSGVWLSTVVVDWWVWWCDGFVVLLLKCGCNWRSVVDGFEFAFLFFSFLGLRNLGFFFFFGRLFELKSLCVLFELKSLFLDFGRMEKMVGLS